MGVDGRLHADGAQQLQGMVLHHVAQGAGGVVKRAAFFDTQFFGNGDLDVGNVFTAPQRLKQCVAKAQGKKVLHRGLAQVVVDAENLLFAKKSADGFVDGPVAGQVVAQRFFQHHTGVGGVESGRTKLFTHGGEQGRCRGHIHHHGVDLALSQCGGQQGVVAGVG